MLLKSLKARLTGLVVAVVAGVWGVTAILTWVEARHEIDEMLDGHLAQAASLLIVQAGDFDSIDTEHAPLLHKYARKVAFQVWRAGQLGVHSLNAPSAPLASGREGFSEQAVDGVRWRVFSTWSGDHEALVHVAERLDARRELADELAGGLLKPLVFALPALALLLWLAVGRGLAVLQRVTAEVERRDPGNLGPLADDDMPAEIRPLTERLNALFARLERSLANERRFTADAAHELRTPLAGIRAQAQVAGAALADGERRHALDAVLVGCDRATRLVEQLLTLARIDATLDATRDATPVDSGDVGLRRLAAETLADFAENAAARRVELVLADGPELSVPGHEGLLRVMLRNLVDNAVRYTAAGGMVEVRISRVGAAVRLAVIDDGPGIPPGERQRVLERFYRILGSGEEGSGLGLSIVRRIVELHGGNLELLDGTSGRGLEVRVTFAAAG